MTPSFIEVARTLALEAGRRIIELSHAPLTRERKPDHSLVTNADHEADRIIKTGLRREFPDHAILTEESGLDGSPDADYLWVVDPLDGTKAYSEGVTGYSVMIGLLKSGVPHAGVVFDPLEDHLYEAVHSQGAYHTVGKTRTLARVSTRRDLAQMPVVTSTGFPKPIEAVLRHSLTGPWIPPVNSVGVKMGYVARQSVDIYINHHRVHYWDTCAPQIILEEAGGRLTFLDGAPVTYAIQKGHTRHEKPTLATNGSRHREVLGILQALKLPIAG